MNKTTEHHCIERNDPDEEMQAIGYPPPLDPAAFARKLAKIIKKGVQKRAFRSAPP
jgi:hypothetical protein